MYPARASIVGHFEDVPVSDIATTVAIDQHEPAMAAKESPSTNPCLALPQSILSKYGRPPASRNEKRVKTDQAKDLETSPLRMTEEQKITDLSHMANMK